MMQSPVKAQAYFDAIENPIVTMAGYQDAQILFMPGYDIISNNVNWFEPGNYSVAYRIKNGSKIIMREVVVLSKHDFLNKGYEYTRIDDRLFLNSSLDKEIMSYVQVGQSILIAHSEYNPNNQDDGSNISISMIQEGVIKWDVLLRQNSFDYITKIIYENNQIIAIGVTYHNLFLQNGWLVVLDENGNIIQDLSYGGQKRDFFFDVILLEDSYVIFGKSNSNNGLFVGKKFIGDDYDATMMVINKQSFAITKIIQFGSNGDDSFEQAMFDGQHYYLLTKTAGFIGEFSNGIDSRRTGIIKMNLAGVIIHANWLPTISEIKFEKMIKSERNQIYTLLSMYSPSLQKTIFQLHRVHQDTSITLVDEYLYPSNSHSIKFVQLWTEQDCIGIVHQLYHYQTNSTRYGYFVRKYMDETHLEDISYTNQTMQIYPIGLLNAETTDLLAITKASTHGSKPTIFKTSKLKVHSLGGMWIDETVNEVENYHIMLNQQRLSHNKELSKTLINSDVFGYYSLQYVFRHPSLIVAFSKEVYVSDRINANSSEIYSLGYMLSFNGIGYLNDTRILNNTPLNQTGEYVLEVYGKDQVKKIIQFRIEDLVDNKKSHLIRNQKISLLETSIARSSSQQNLKITYESQKKPLTDLIELNQFEHWYFIFPLICIPITIIQIMKGIKQ
jgi:hypothetical protein